MVVLFTLVERGSGFGPGGRHVSDRISEINAYFGAGRIL